MAASPFDALSPELQAKLRPFLRRAFRPTLGEHDLDGTVSKLAGRPWLATGTQWPLCPNCERPMQLLLQLDESSLPKGAPARDAKGSHLLQLFYCTTAEPNCEDDCEAYFAFSKAVVARRIDTRAGGATAPTQLAADPLPARSIESWEAIDDLPHWEERDEHGLELTETEADAIDEADADAASGEKLGGWPSWVQSTEYPDCPDCGTRMRLVFQIDSHQALPISFGDYGRGHLTQCPKHLGVLSFGWACG